MVETIRALEERTFNAWPSLQTVHVDGWLLRTALGHTKRANAASALHPQGSIPPQDFVELVKAHYDSHAIAPMVRITPLTPKAYEAAFRAAGWTDFDPTDVLMRELSFPMPQNGPALARLEEQPSEQWVQGAAEAYGFKAWQQAALAQIVGNIRVPARFVTMIFNDETAGYGLGVYERGFVGLYDLAIHPRFRGRGIGQQMIFTLMEWARLRGETTAYLQVRRENEGAQRLYRGLGFQPVYSYFCLRPERI